MPKFDMMSLFSANPPAMPQQQQQQQQQQQPQGTQGQQVQGGGQQLPQMQDPVANIAATAGVTTQAGTNGTQAQGTVQGAQPNANSLDNYKDMFKMQEGQQQQAEAIDAPLFKLDSDALSQSMSKANFMPQVDPQLMQRALGGDQQAFSEVMNGVARNVMQQAISLTQSMVQSGIGTYHKRLDGMLPDRMREFTANESLATDPSASHPAASPVMKALVQQAMKANPSLTVAQAVKQATGFMQAMSAQYAPPPAAQGKDPLTGQSMKPQTETDWASEFN